MTKAKRKRTNEEMRKLGSLGGKATVRVHGLQHYVDAGKRGGNIVKDKYGAEHFAELGRKGGARLRELAARGRAAESRTGRKSA